MSSDFLKAFNSLMKAYVYGDDSDYKQASNEDMLKDIEQIKSEIVKNKFLRVLKKFVKKNG
jgi:hypothetical protein